MLFKKSSCIQCDPEVLRFLVVLWIRRKNQVLTKLQFHILSCQGVLCRTGKSFCDLGLLLCGSVSSSPGNHRMAYCVETWFDSVYMEKADIVMTIPEKL